jgi:cytoplasmic tRNA 2-thiolation protein 1
MAKLVPGSDEGCGGTCASAIPAADEEEGGGCGSSNGRTAGGEMARVEQHLAQNEAAAENGLEVEITTSRANGTPNNTVPLRNSKKSKGKPTPSRKLPKQVMGQCKVCGYLSSQDICKACMLLDGLNKNRPKNNIEVGYEGEQEEQTIDAVANGVKHVTVNGT